MRQRKWRNRRIAEALERCGLVERPGQGADIMFGESIREAKPLPSFDGTDEHHVVLHLYGVVRNPEFLQVMDAIGLEKLELFEVEDFLLIDEVFQRGRTAAPRERIDRLGRGKLVQHLRESGNAGAAGELSEVLPALTRFRILGLLKELRREGRVHLRGAKSSARWFIGAEQVPDS